MDYFISQLLPTVVLLAVVYSVFRHLFTKRSRVWEAVAQEVGLEHVRKSSVLGLPSELRGEIEGCAVRLASGTRRDRTQTCLALDTRGRVPTSLSVRPEGLGATLLLAAGGRELTVGDPSFDDAVYLRGPENLVLSLLDAPTRLVLREVVGMDGRIADGKLNLVCEDGDDPDAVAYVLETALRAVRLLQPPENAVERLGDIARHDPVLGVRRRCLALLAHQHAGHSVARDVLREALASPDAETRLLAAIALGDEGEAELTELACDASLQEDVVTRALAALGARLPLTRALGLLDAALEAGRRLTALAVIRSLAAIGDASAAGRLLPLLRHRLADLAVEAARALGVVRAPSAEAPLVQALTSERDELRRAAAAALGRLGSASAVGPLRTAAASGVDGELRRAALEAIEAIQSRAPEDAPGRIALAPGAGGELSVSDDSAAGRLSVARPRQTEGGR